jgi:RES domain-containing protein
MLRLYRISKTLYANDITAQGCLYASGRWHRQGTRVLYTSEHLSLAKLEILANATFLPKNCSLVTYEVSEVAIKTLSIEDLASNWQDFPYPEELAMMTENWVKENKYWIMKVPSAQAPTEYNYLLNPLHTDHNRLKIISIEPHKFDSRLK